LNLQKGVELSGSVSLEIGGQALTGTILSGGIAEGRSSYRVIGGSGGWGQDVDSKGYADDSGVKVRSVAQDLASKVGETIEDLPTTRLGPHYARKEGPAYIVLNSLFPRNWYVGLDGVTRVGTWPETTYTGRAPRPYVDAAGAVIDLAVEDLTSLVPGVIVDDQDPAGDVEWLIGEKRLTARIYGSPKLARRQEAMRALILGLFPQLAFPPISEYRVVSQSGERLNLQPARSSTGLPDLARVPVRPGLAGTRNNVTPGELVLVALADWDPSRPNVISHDAPDAPGWMPLTIELGGHGALGIVRLGDTVQAGPWPGVTTSASARVKAST
jgi:hypothetical protein